MGKVVLTLVAVTALLLLQAANADPPRPGGPGGKPKAPVVGTRPSPSQP